MKEKCWKIVGKKGTREGKGGGKGVKRRKIGEKKRKERELEDKGGNERTSEKGRLGSPVRQPTRNISASPYPI